MAKLKKAKRIILCLAFLAFVWSLIEARLLQSNSYDFYSPQVPQVFDGYKIAFITDIHAGILFSVKRVDRLVDKINKADPDIVILGGDYVFAGRKIIPQLAASLGRINARTVAVMGNHDNWEAPDLIKDEFAKNGIEMIDNRGIWIGRKVERIRIGGVDDWQTAGSFLSGVLEGVNENDFVVLDSHNPDVTYLLDEEDRVDLVLSGHTHGGQISFFGLWSPLLPISHGQSYSSGWIDGGNFKLFVSRGVGDTILPMRFFSMPEWDMITLKTGN